MATQFCVAKISFNNALIFCQTSHLSKNINTVKTQELEGNLFKRSPNQTGEKYKAKILLKFYYLVGICKLQVMRSITW